MRCRLPATPGNFDITEDFYKIWIHFTHTIILFNKFKDI
jgi:hypothetical protein